MTELLAIRRLLLALPDGRLESARLQSLAALAVRMEVELMALFVEDEGLLRAGRLPVALEVGHVSARVRGLSGQAVEIALRSAAERTRQVLEATARASSLPFSFQVARGRPLASALAFAGEVDAVLFPGRASFVPGARKRHAPAIVMLAAGEELPRRVAAALRFADACGAEAIFGLLADDEAGYLALRQDVQTLLGARLRGVRFLRASGPVVETTCRAARDYHAATVAVPATLSPAILGELMLRLRCPLLLLS
ncbi:MAG: hypothetical protein PHQ14_07175 [Chromatiales bacterium]|nr:hypothetical protein [Chromatiales bacterium]MDX9765761.1 hypothetical protein [Ectothiorhodospiraceae bacterium]